MISELSCATLPGVEFRYAQTCPLARAAEVLGHRWNLLILRDLFLGPQRFSDLRRRLAGVSSSVLAERLRDLEARGVVCQRELPPPAASSIYELTPLGRAFWPALRALARWGVLFQLGAGRRPDDHFEPDWVRLGAACFARQGATPPHRVRVAVVAGRGRPDVVFRVAGGEAGTRVLDAEGPSQASVRGTADAVLAAFSGAPPATLEIEGDPQVAAALPLLFDLEFSAPPHPEGTP